MITQRGQTLEKLDSENKKVTTCPFTQNAKFETFLEDLFDMQVGPATMRRQIQDYVKCIETHYTDIIKNSHLKMKRIVAQSQKERGKAALEKNKRSELEEVLIDAIDKTRLQIFKRKLALERSSAGQKEMVKVVQMLGNELGGQHSINSFISEASETEGFA